jgi:hypothetical protein
LLFTLAIAFIWVQQHRLTQSRLRIECLDEENKQLAGLRGELARLQRLAVDQAELDELRADKRTNQLELAQLRAIASAAKRAEMEVSRLRMELERQATRVPETTNTIPSSMAEMMKSSLEQATQRKLSRMQEKLRLSPAQAQAVQAILSRQTQGTLEGVKGANSGKPDSRKIAELRGTGGNPAEEIRSLLSPEQQTAYEAMKDEEAVNNARLAANSELIQMQGHLGLDASQQDKVYAVLFEQLRSQFREESSGRSTSANPAQAMQAMQERRLRALEGILTPDQMEGYRQQQDRQIQFMKKIVAQAEPPAHP